FPEIVQGFPDLVRIEYVSLLQEKNPRQDFGLENQPLVRIGASKRELAHPVQLALRNRDGDIRRLPVFGANDRKPGNSAAAFIYRFEILHVHDDLEVTVILIESSNAYFEVFIELRAIERLAHHRNVSDVKRNA